MWDKILIMKWGFERIVALIGLFVSLGGFSVAYIELNNIEKTTSGNLALEIYKDTRSDRVFKNNPQIVRAIYNDKKILKENGGELSEDDLDNYLGLYEWIASANENGFLSDEMLYTFHSDLIKNTYSHKEIRSYLDRVRADDKEFYQGFVDLVEKVKILERDY